jgi:hypothetical protein
VVSTPSLAEVKAVTASRQGLSCETYFTLFTRTAHLRESLYITVRDGDKLFLPRAGEHFPVREIEEHYLGRMQLGFLESIGAGGKSPIVFTCEGAAEEAAEEGVRLITATLAELEPLLLKSLIPRTIASIPHKKLYRAALQSESPPYRPEALPKRDGEPIPVTREERSSRRPGLTPEHAAQVVREKEREYLKRWGLLEEAERYGLVGHASRQSESQPAPPASSSTQSFNNTPWEETRWT